MFRTFANLPGGRRPRFRVARPILALAAAGLLTVGIAPPAQAEPSSQDLDYMTANAHTNLAEITLADIVLERSGDAGARELAMMTKADHSAALVANTLGVDLPDAPSPAQQADAATLQATSDADFDLTYAQIQVAGHQASVAATEKEIADGTERAVNDYATGYLPKASHHLDMAQMLLSDLGGTPTVVPAGTGGLAGANPTSALTAILILVGMGMAAVGAGLLLRRRTVR